MQGWNTEVARRRESGRSIVESAESSLGKRLVAEKRKPTGNEGRVSGTRRGRAWCRGGTN